MSTPNIDNKTDNELNKEFWDSLHTEIIKSNIELSREHTFSYVEKSFVFSLFFRGTSHKELNIFRSILNLQDLGYLILIEFLPKEKTNIIDFDIDEHTLYHLIKKELAGVATAIGPIISNRLSILVTDGPQSLAPGNDIKTSSLSITTKLVDALQNEFRLNIIAGIGNVQSIHSIYTSFIEALSCMHYCNPSEIIHIQDLEQHDKYYIYDYKEAEKLMIEAVHLKKSESYDYFVLMMNRIKPLSDTAKRNRIIEALVLASHASRTDEMEEIDHFDYTCNINKLMELKDSQLIEWAFQKFFDITGFVKKHNAIDYSNKIVQATKEYLEAHYSEEISLEDVADYVNISPQYFSKLIKKNTGFNFIDWLSMLRVKRAKDLLTNSNLTVKEVCFMVGYKDPNYFSRIFKKKIGMTPSEYIKMNNLN
jgi:two-component system response regulator YesN